MKHLYIILLILPLIGFGQGWEVTFGGIESDVGSCVQQTMDGGYVITGYTYPIFISPMMDGDIHLIKTDENGNEEWSKIFGGEGLDRGNSVQQTSDGGYIIIGTTESFGDGYSNTWLIKTDGIGNEEWNQNFGGDSPEFIYSSGHSVQQTDDGGYIITGVINEVVVGVLLMKVDSNGEEEWYTKFGENSSVGNSIQLTSDGGYVICGSHPQEDCDEDECECEETLSDVYLIKMDGDEEWSQTFGEECVNEVGNSVQQTTDGGYIICGTSQTPDSDINMYLIKTDGSGNEEWSQTFGGNGVGFGSSVQQTTDGGYIITGGTNSSGGYLYDVYLIKTDENGNEQWSQTFGGQYNDIGYSVQQTDDGGYIVTGYKTLDDYNQELYIIKTDSQGNVTSTIELPTPTSKRELIKTTNILGQENTTIKNQPLIEIYDDGSTEKKIVLEK